MKSFKYTFILFVVISGSIALPHTVQAQTQAWIEQIKKAPPLERAVMQTDLMKSKLALNDWQYQQTNHVNKKYALLIAPILAGDDSKFSKYRQIKALMETKDQELKKIFTADQFGKYQEVEKELIAKWSARP